MRKELIRTKMKEIEESIRSVEEHFPDTFEEFSSMGLVKDGMYKRIEFAIANVFDICAIINADLELGIPSAEEDIVENLVKDAILSEEMRAKLKAMKGFRNILVHRYGKIDDNLAFTIMKEKLRDFYAFLKRRGVFLEDEEWRL
jgi:uncharacterized protein YutE (UPF0331/DUF86 family)